MIPLEVPHHVTAVEACPFVLDDGLIAYGAFVLLVMLSVLVYSLISVGRWTEKPWRLSSLCIQ